MRPIICDRIALVSTGFAVAAVLVSLQRLIFYEELSDEWFLMIVFTAFVFGASGYMCFSWLRKEQLRRTWPLAVTFFGLLALHSGIVGSVIRLFHPRWRAPGWLFLLLIEIPIVVIALELAHDYSKARKAVSFLDFIRSIRHRRGLP